MTSERSISVIIPTFNRRQLVMAAVDSVLSQRMNNCEVIVVDDGSTDNTRELFEKPLAGVRYIYQDNLGVSAARNRGLAESAGELIAFLDSDDLWAPGKLKAQIGLVTSDSVLSFQGVEWFVDNNESEHLLKQTSKVLWPRLDVDGFVRDPVLDVAEGRYFHLGAMMCTRTAFMEVGWFDRALCMGEDEDWFSRASLLKRFHYDPTPYLRRRFHKGQTAMESERSLLSLVTVFERIAARTATSNRKAAQAAGRRLSGKWSHLANCLNAQGRKGEALEAMRKACVLSPFNVPRLAKLMLMSGTNFQIRRY